MKMLAALALAMLLPGCATSIPSMHTEGPWAGRCVTINYIPILDMGAYMAAEMMDGWKCAGLADGAMPRTGTKAEFREEIRAKNEAALAAIRAKQRGAEPPAVVPPAAAVKTEPTWSTGY